MPENRIPFPEPIRKAAVLVATLEPAAADALLARMPAEQAARIRAAVMELGEPDTGEQGRVLAEFARAGGAAATNSRYAGIELAPSLEHRWEQSPTYAPPETRTPFHFLHESEACELVPHLIQEHPQTMAVVVSHLRPERAAEVLASLPARLQAEVAERLVDLDEADPEVVREIESQLESVLAEQVRARSRSQAGLVALKTILRAAPAHNRLELMANLEERASWLATKLHETEEADSSTHFHREAGTSTPRPLPTVRTNTNAAAPPATSAANTPAVSPAPSTPAEREASSAPALAFTDLVRLSDRELGLVLKEAGHEVSLLALAAASKDVLARVLRPLPAHEARAFRKRLGQIVPVRLREVEEAQRRLLEIAGLLVARRQGSAPRTVARAAA